MSGEKTYGGYNLEDKVPSRPKGYTCGHCVHREGNGYCQINAGGVTSNRAACEHLLILDTQTPGDGHQPDVPTPPAEPPMYRASEAEGAMLQVWRHHPHMGTAMHQIKEAAERGECCCEVDFPGLRVKAGAIAYFKTLGYRVKATSRVDGLQFMVRWGHE